MPARQFRYIVVPGSVVSANDGDLHWIDAKQLVRLYGLAPRSYLVANKLEHAQLLLRQYPDAQVLGPRSDGCYRLDSTIDATTVNQETKLQVQENPVLIDPSFLPVDQNGQRLDCWASRVFEVQCALAPRGKEAENMFVFNITTMLQSILGITPVAQGYDGACRRITNYFTACALSAADLGLPLRWDQLPEEFRSKTIPQVRAALQAPEYLLFFGATTVDEVNVAWKNLHGFAGFLGSPDEWTDTRVIFYLDRRLSPEPFKRAPLKSYATPNLDAVRRTDFRSAYKSVATGRKLTSHMVGDYYVLTPGLQAPTVESERDAQLKTLMTNLVDRTRKFTDAEVDDFCRSIELAFRLTDAVSNVTDAELAAAVEYLQDRRARLAGLTSRVKVKILEPTYVVDPEPEPEPEE